ncbi:ester cyclase [Kribbella sp. NPDC056951]|uniref:ester cyclase n=1 Tax=Kribbella sp. NPDC056951 TaxID=3345978 RepID=UPI0036372A13
MAIDRRSLIKNSGAVGFGALALAAVNDGTALAHSDYPAHLSPDERRHLRIFDELDFEIFTGQKWNRLDESHARNIKVHWPDGHSTDGIDKHIADLKAMFVWAPDTRIQQHPLRLATNELTAVTGIMEGTFTRPMPDGKGGYIKPTGKAYKITMATVGIWNRRHTMDEEYLFWDNQSFYAQIGLG